MANYDGSIRLNIDFDNQGYKRSFQELKRSAVGVSKEVDTTMSKMASGKIDFSSGVRQLQQLEHTMLRIREQAGLLGERFKGLDRIKVGIGVTDIQKSLTGAKSGLATFYSFAKANNVDLDMNDADFLAKMESMRNKYNELINDLSDKKVDLKGTNASAFDSSGSSGSVQSQISSSGGAQAGASSTQASLGNIGNMLSSISGKGSNMSSMFSSMAGGASKLSMAVAGVGVALAVTVAVLKVIKKLFELIEKLAQFVLKSIKKGVDNFKAVNGVLKDMAVGVAKVSRGFLDFVNNAGKALGITDKLNDKLSTMGFGGLVNANLLSDAIRKTASELKGFTTESIEAGSNFQSYYLRVRDTFGESSSVIYEYAKNATIALGMSETAFLEASSKIGVFAKSYITDVDDLSNVTVGLTTAIADLAAQTGSSIDETMTKVLSGLRGNTEAIEELGINVKVADLQNWMNTQGISGAFESLNSNMQNLYRTWYLLDKVQSNGSMGYASKMMNTYSGNVRVLQAQLLDLKTIIGTYLMQALVPVIQLANMLLASLLRVANSLGKVFGLLDKYDFTDSLGFGDTSGVSGIYEDAVNSIGLATDAETGFADAATKAGEAIKKSLAPLHKLNVLQSNASSSSGGVSGGSVDAPSVGDDLVKLPSTGMDTLKKEVDLWIDTLKGAIKDGDWYGVGALLGYKLNQIVYKIDFKKTRDFLTKWAVNIASVLNGFFDHVGWGTLGRKVGDGISSVVAVINAFLTKVNFRGIGTALANFGRGLLTSIDFEAVGTAWSQKTRVLIDILIGFVQGLSKIDPTTGLVGWAELGIAISTFLDSAINNIPWADLGTSLADGLNGVFTTAVTFFSELNNVDLFTGESKLSSTIGSIITGINNAITGFDPSLAAESLFSLVNTIFTTLHTAFMDLDWVALGTSVGTFIGESLAGIDWNEFGDTIVALADGLLALFTNAIDGLQESSGEIVAGFGTLMKKIADWLADPANQKEIADGVNSIVTLILDLIKVADWTELNTSLSEVLGAIDWSDMLLVLNFPDLVKKSIKTEIAEATFTDVAGDVAKVLALVAAGIFLLFNPMLLLATILALLLVALIKGLAKMMPAIKLWFKTLGLTIKTKFGEIKTSIGEALTKAWETVKTKFIAIKDVVVEKATEIWGAVKEKFGAIKDVVFEKAVEIWTTIKEKFGDIKDAVFEKVTEIWTTIKETFTGIWTTVSEKVTDVWTTIKETFTGIWTTVSEKVTSVWTTIKETFTGIWTTISEKVTSVWTTIKETFTGIWTTVTEKVTGIKDSIVEKFTTIKTEAEDIFGKVKDKVIETFDNIKEGIKTPINAILGIVENMVNGIIGGVNKAISALNGFDVTLPDWIPGDLGGKHFGFDITELSKVTIPQLANGAVINPNQRFLAELGDQTKGINIETPLNTMITAFKTALNDGGYGSGGNITIPVSIGGEQIDEIVVNANNRANFRRNGR